MVKKCTSYNYKSQAPKEFPGEIQQQVPGQRQWIFSLGLHAAPASAGPWLDGFGSGASDAMRRHQAVIQKFLTASGPD